MAEPAMKFVRESPPGTFRVQHPLAVNAKDGSVLVYVPAGSFEMGSAAGEGSDDERPRHRVELSAYWIGVYAVSNAQYLKFMAATRHRAPGNQVHTESRCADHPVTDVDWNDAVAYARWAGCELPTEAQWEKACRGPLGLTYPWGPDWDETKCRNDKNKGNETTAPVYDYPAGVSGYGTYNQSGNVWEWCADWNDKDYYARSPVQDPRGPESGSVRVYRGGSWWSDGPGRFRAAIRNWCVPGYRDVNLGLRLVRAAS